MCKLQVAVFGIGNNWKLYKDLIENKYQVTSLIDNKFIKGGELNINGITCATPNDLCRLEWDKVLILPSGEAKLDIARQLLSLGVEEKDIILYYPEAHRKWQDYSVTVMDNNFHAHFDDIEFDVIHKTDAIILEDIYMNFDYGLITGAESLLVLDIGMNVGLASLFFSSQPNVTEVHGFEPFKPTYDGALHNFNLNPRYIQNKLHPHCVGLSNHTDTLKLSYNEDLPGGMGIHGQMDADGVEMKLVDASEVLRPILMGRTQEKVLAKIDVEGSEYEILQSLNQSGLLRQIDYIIMETHCAREHEAEKIILDNGFVYFYNHGILGLGGIREIKM